MVNVIFGPALSAYLTWHDTEYLPVMIFALNNVIFSWRVYRISSKLRHKYRVEKVPLYWVCKIYQIYAFCICILSGPVTLMVIAAPSVAVGVTIYSFVAFMYGLSVGVEAVYAGELSKKYNTSLLLTQILSPVIRKSTMRLKVIWRKYIQGL